MKQLLCIICAVLLTACTTRTESLTVRTPNGERTVTVNEGRYSRDRSETIDSTKAYQDCLAQRNARTDPHAEEYCRNATAAGPVGADGYGYGTYGTMPGMGPMGGFEYNPNSFFPMPDHSTPASRAMERATSPSVIMNVPMYVPYGPSNGAPGQSDDYDLIVREQKLLHDRLCAVEASQGRPCK